MFFKNYLLKETVKRNAYFIWKNENKSIHPIKDFIPLNLNLIIGIDSQKEILLIALLIHSS